MEIKVQSVSAGDKKITKTQIDLPRLFAGLFNNPISETDDGCYLLNIFALGFALKKITRSLSL